MVRERGHEYKSIIRSRGNLGGLIKCFFENHEFEIIARGRKRVREGGIFCFSNTRAMAGTIEKRYDILLIYIRPTFLI